jgi:hypothetical protein
MSTEREIADALTKALHRLGIVTYVTVQDYKDAPGGPMLEIMLKPADGEVLWKALP